MNTCHGCGLPMTQKNCYNCFPNYYEPRKCDFCGELKYRIMYHPNNKGVFFACYECFDAKGTFTYLNFWHSIKNDLPEIPNKLAEVRGYRNSHQNRIISP